MWPIYSPGEPGVHGRYGPMSPQQKRHPPANTLDKHAGESTDAPTTAEKYAKHGATKSKAKKSREQQSEVSKHANTSDVRPAQSWGTFVSKK